MHGSSTGPVAAVGILVVVVLVVGWALARGRRRPTPSGPGRTPTVPPARLPEPREIWWATVPFDDGTGAKDRPCLVLRRGAHSATVLKITSKHHAELPGVIPLPPGTVGDRDHRASWLEADESREVPLADFRRRVGAVDPQLWARVRRARA